MWNANRKTIALNCNDMPYLAPRLLPTLNLLLDDMPESHPKHISRHLGVTERTVWGWKAAEQAPRAAMLALFWESRWGKSAISTSLQNDAQVYHQHCRTLEAENARLRSELQRVMRLSQCDTANSPIFRQL